MTRPACRLLGARCSPSAPWPRPEPSPTTTPCTRARQFKTGVAREAGDVQGRPRRNRAIPQRLPGGGRHRPPGPSPSGPGPEGLTPRFAFAGPTGHDGPDAAGPVELRHGLPSADHLHGDGPRTWLREPAPLPRRPRTRRRSAGPRVGPQHRPRRDFRPRPPAFGRHDGDVDQAVCIQRPARLDDWVRYQNCIPSASHGCAVGTGQFFAADGTLLALVGQEMIFRPRTASS
ncbi:hypothetical protein [Blastococcus sp. SYSU DS1024]